MYGERDSVIRTRSYLGHGLVASSDVYQSVGLEHVVDFVAGVFVQSAHGKYIIFGVTGLFEVLKSTGTYDTCCVIVRRRYLIRKKVTKVAREFRPVKTYKRWHAPNYWRQVLGPRTTVVLSPVAYDGTGRSAGAVCRYALSQTLRACACARPITHNAVEQWTVGVGLHGRAVGPTW